MPATLTPELRDLMSRDTTPRESVTPAALIKRIDRKLVPRWERVCKSRGLQQTNNVGEYYLLDWNHNVIVRPFVDLESFAREIGVLGINQQLER